jgi:hypothetical protein
MSTNSSRSFDGFRFEKKQIEIPAFHRETRSSLLLFRLFIAQRAMSDTQRRQDAIIARSQSVIEKLKLFGLVYSRVRSEMKFISLA